MTNRYSKTGRVKDGQKIDRITSKHAEWDELMQKLREDLKRELKEELETMMSESNDGNSQSAPFIGEFHLNVSFPFGQASSHPQGDSPFQSVMTAAVPVVLERLFQSGKLKALFGNGEESNQEQTSEIIEQFLHSREIQGIIKDLVEKHVQQENSMDPLEQLEEVKEDED